MAAYASCAGIRSTVFCPDDTPDINVREIQSLGAETYLVNGLINDCGKIVGDGKEKVGWFDVSTLKEPYRIEGKKTMGLELAEQISERQLDVSAILCCCGGGGLSAGIATAMAVTNPAVTLHTAEPLGFDDTARSLSLGKRVANKTEQGSICDAIVTPTPGEITFPILKALAGRGFTVSDDQTLRAMRCAFDTLKLVIEPGGAVALAAALFAENLPSSDDLVVIVSGGNVDEKIFARALTIS